MDHRAQRLLNLADRLTDMVAAPLDQCVTPVDRLICQAALYERITRANLCQRSLRRYQRKRGISGLHWNTIQFCGHTVAVPYLHEGLSPTRDDVRQLYAAKTAILEFGDRIAPYFQVWTWDQIASQEDQYPWLQSHWQSQRQILEAAHWLTLYYVDRIQRHPQGGEMPVHYFWVAAHFSQPTRLDDDFFPVVLNNSPPATLDLIF